MAAEINLDNIVGDGSHFYLLDAVDTFVEKVVGGFRDDDANVIRFRLNGIIYTATENPSDGYRSHMRSLIVELSTEMKNVFPPIEVTARKVPNDDNYTNDILELVDRVTGKVVLEVGTRRTNDYYPSFVSAFYPENMWINAEPRFPPNEPAPVKPVVPPSDSPHWGRF